MRLERNTAYERVFNAYAHLIEIRLISEVWVEEAKTVMLGANFRFLLLPSDQRDMQKL